MFLLKRWTEEKILCMLKNLFSLERFATFANDRVTFLMHNDGKTTTDVYQRFPKNRKTLGVRWPKRHGVTAPIVQRWSYEDCDKSLSRLFCLKQRLCIFTT